MYKKIKLPIQYFYLGKLKKLNILILLFFYSINSHCQLKEFLVATRSYYGPNSIEYLQKSINFGANTIVSAGCTVPEYNINEDSYTKTLLNNASSLNLKVILNVNQLFASTIVKDRDYTYDENKIMAELQFYQKYPALAGYYLSDDPILEEFETEGKVASLIDSFNPNIIHFGALLDNSSEVIGKDYQGKWPSYEQYSKYIQDYIDIVHPKVFEFYSYPIPNKYPRFFENLDVVAIKSAINNIPFIFCTTHYSGIPLEWKAENPYESITLPQFRFLLFSSLVYGSKGIDYWQMDWTSGFKEYVKKNDMFELIPNETQNFLYGLHTKLRNNSSTLLNLRFRGAYHVKSTATTDDTYGRIDVIPNHSLWENFKNDNFAKEIFNVVKPIEGNSDDIVISFLVDNFGKRYFWVFNKSVNLSTNIKLNFKNYFSLIDVLENTSLNNSNSLNITLATGEAKLYAVDNAVPNVLYINGPKTFDSNIGNIYASQISIKGPEVKYVTGAEVNYRAEKSVISPGVQILKGSSVSFKRLIIVNNQNIELRQSKQPKESVVNHSSEKDENQPFDFMVLPNPSKGLLELSFVKNDSQKIDVQIIDFSGKTIVNQNTNLNKITIDITAQPSGIYFIKATFNKNVVVKKIIKQ